MTGASLDDVRKMPHDPKRKRWTACGLCTACLATDCGDCINCLDKPKFGGQGVRKQSCVMRRCVRMTNNGSYGNGHSASGSSHGKLADAKLIDADIEQHESGGVSEQALFRAALSGLRALNGQTAADSAQIDADAADGTAVTTSFNASPRSPAYSDMEDSPGTNYRRSGMGERSLSIDQQLEMRALGYGPGNLAGAPATGADSFCCKLATVLASDRRLTTQPIVLRALQRAGVVDPLATISGVMAPTVSAPKFAAALSDPHVAAQLASHIGAGSTPTGSSLRAPEPYPISHPAYGMEPSSLIDFSARRLEYTRESYAPDSAPRVEMGRDSYTRGVEMPAKPTAALS